MIVGAFLLFALIDRVGGGTIAVGAIHGTASTEPAQTNILAHVLITLAAVVVVGQLFGRVFRYLGQPPVIGEVLAGIALGPS